MPTFSYSTDQVEFYLGSGKRMSMNLGTGQELAGLHFQLSCYVCGPACTKPSPFEGWVTFAKIFERRPDGCRFAVARMVPILLIRQTDAGQSRAVVGDPAGPFLVWDLFDEKLVRGGGRVGDSLIPPLPIWQGDSEDGMVMKAMALIDNPRFR